MAEVESDILSEVIGCRGYHQRVPQYGERAWIAEGENVNVIYWDVGNGWCDIMDVAPKNGWMQNEVIEFYRVLYQAIDRHYDDEGGRID